MLQLFRSPLWQSTLSEVFACSRIAPGEHLLNGPEYGPRYGSGLGSEVNSYLVGLSGAPVTYYAPTPLLITAEGGSFASGQIRLAVHVACLIPPRSD